MCRSFIIEGTVGVGKTTTLNILGSLNPSWKLRPEPLEAWEKFDFGNGREINLLKNFYSQKTGDSFRQLQVGFFEIVLIFFPPTEKFVNSRLTSILP